MHPETVQEYLEQAFGYYNDSMKKEDTMSTTVEMNIKTPPLPTVITAEGYGKSIEIPLNKLTDAQVDAIIKAWGAKLKEKVKTAKENTSTYRRSGDYGWR